MGTDHLEIRWSSRMAIQRLRHEQTLDEYRKIYDTLGNELSPRMIGR